MKTRLSLSGPLVVARDIAHARIKDMLDNGEPMPIPADHAVYYAGPRQDPGGLCERLLRPPRPPGRMDAYVDAFQKAGGSFVMLAKGNRSKRA